MKEHFSDFHRSEDEFLKLINTSDEPKDEYSILIKSKI